MQTVLFTLAVLACPVGMGAMMLFMGKSMRGSRSSGTSTAATAGDELASLKEQQQAISGKIERLENDAATSVGAS